MTGRRARETDVNIKTIHVTGVVGLDDGKDCLSMILFVLLHHDKKISFIIFVCTAKILI